MYWMKQLFKQARYSIMDGGLDDGSPPSASDIYPAKHFLDPDVGGKLRSMPLEDLLDLMNQVYLDRDESFLDDTGMSVGQNASWHQVYIAVESKLKESSDGAAWYVFRLSMNVMLKSVSSVCDEERIAIFQQVRAAELEKPWTMNPQARVSFAEGNARGAIFREQERRLNVTADALCELMGMLGDEHGDGLTLAQVHEAASIRGKSSDKEEVLEASESAADLRQGFNCTAIASEVASHMLHWHGVWSETRIRAVVESTFEMFDDLLPEVGRTQ